MYNIWRIISCHIQYTVRRSYHSMSYLVYVRLFYTDEHPTTTFVRWLVDSCKTPESSPRSLTPISKEDVWKTGSKSPSFKGF